MVLFSYAWMTIQMCSIIRRFVILSIPRGVKKIELRTKAGLENSDTWAFAPSI